MESSVLTLLGSSGLGAVWGWYVALAAPSHRRVLSLIAATPLLVGEVGAVAGWQRVVPFLGVAAVAWLFHFSWRRALARRATAR